MKNIIKVFIVGLFCSFSLLLYGCGEEKTITKIEVLEHPTYSYTSGGNINDFALSGGKIKIFYSDDTTETKSFEKEWLGEANYLTGKVKITYMEQEVEATFTQVSYVDTNEKLVATQTSTDKIFIIKTGTYEVEYLRYDNDVILIGEEGVIINITGATSGQAGALFQNNVSMKNIEFNSTHEDILINCVKIGKIETEGDVPLISKAYLENIKIKGGKGLNIMAVSDAVLDNIEVDIVDTTKNVAFAVSAGSNVKLKNSKITHGTWGSIAIFGVNEDSAQTWYKRKSTLEISDTEISSAVYIEYFAVNNSTVSGLTGWAMTELTNNRVYTKNATEE